MKLPEKIRAKVQSEETAIRANNGDDFYEWAVDPDTELANPNELQSIYDALYGVVD